MSPLFKGLEKCSFQFGKLIKCYVILNSHFKRNRTLFLKSKKSTKDYKVKNSEIIIGYFRRRHEQQESFIAKVLGLDMGTEDGASA